MNPLIRARSPVIVVTKLSHFLQKKSESLQTEGRHFRSIICIGAKLAGAAGARAPPLFNPRPEIYSIKCA